jgi:hypothetical protein
MDKLKDLSDEGMNTQTAPETPRILGGKRGSISCLRDLNMNLRLSD